MSVKFYFSRCKTFTFLVIVALSNALWIANDIFSQYHQSHTPLFYSMHLQTSDFTKKLGNGNMKLCVIFTTFKNKQSRLLIQRNTLLNWAQFIPLVQPVLFLSQSTEPTYREMAERLGWHVYSVPKANRYGTPFIYDMVMTILNGTYNATFYGFANGDILFDNSLISTLTAVSSARTFASPIMITGRRTNVKLNDSRTAELVVDDQSLVNKLSREEGRLYGTNAEDYFIFSKDISRLLFIKQLVFGRPAYDNYLVSMAKKRKVNVIDATRTLIALHLQSTSEPDEAGFNNTDFEHNSNVIAITGKFGYQEGETDHIRYETVLLDDVGAIIIRDRANASRTFS